jgi:hypothetical protein
LEVYVAFGRLDSLPNRQLVLPIIAARYSEDIDLVVVGSRPAEHIRRAVRRVLADVLGKPKTSVLDTITLAMRNTVKPSRILRMTYAVRSIIEPGRSLDIVVEANVTERKPHRSAVEIPFDFPFRGETIQTKKPKVTMFTKCLAQKCGQCFNSAPIWRDYRSSNATEIVNTVSGNPTLKYSQNEMVACRLDF